MVETHRFGMVYTLALRSFSTALLLTDKGMFTAGS